MKRSLLVLSALLSLAVARWQSIGPDGGYFQAFTVDRTRLFAVPYEYPANARVFVSTDRGGSWSTAGTMPFPSVTLIAADPHDDTILYALARGEALYRSTDRGARWSQVTLPGYAAGIALDMRQRGWLYLAGYYYYNAQYRPAAYISSDFGRNWSVSMPRPDTTGYAYAIAVDPQAASTVYLGANSALLYKTTDAGATWARASSGLGPNSSTQALSVSPADSRIVLAAQSDGMFRSVDGGERWTQVGALTGVMGAGFGADGSSAYALGRSDSMRVWVSTDAGASWRLPVPGLTTLKTAQLKSDPVEPGTAWLAGQTGIHRSTDYGAHWFPAHAGLRVTSIPCISASPRDPSRLFITVKDDGLYTSPDAGGSWSRLPDFLDCGNICEIGIARGGARDVLYALEGSG